MIGQPTARARRLRKTERTIDASRWLDGTHPHQILHQVMEMGDLLSEHLSALIRNRWSTMESTIVQGVTLRHHMRDDCTPPCPLHQPSDHTMVDLPLSWRADRGIFERVCPHGVGHPDPDSLTRMGDLADGLHGCDGCCAPKEGGTAYWPACPNYDPKGDQP